MARRYQVMRALPAFSTGSPWRLQVWPLQFCALQPDQRLMGLATASRGSASDLKWARQAGESWDFLATMHAVTRPTSGMAALQRRNASLLQACSCSGVWALAAADHIENESAVASNNPN